VKLWTIKTSECVATFEDAHDSKIWAMAMTPDQRRVLTGGSDSVLNIWHDVSSLDVEEQEAKRETFLLQEQELTNLIRHKQFKQAVSMCLTLEQPRKAYTIVQELMVKENKDHTPSEIPEIVTSLEDDLLSRLILYIRDWNTHAKTSHVAQTVSDRQCARMWMTFGSAVVWMLTVLS
jgi:U3 small nucleolar RNA-associated protein 13